MLKNLVLNLRRCWRIINCLTNGRLGLHWRVYWQKCFHKDLSSQRHIVTKLLGGLPILTTERPKAPWSNNAKYISSINKWKTFQLPPPKVKSDRKGHQLVFFYPSDSVHWKLSFIPPFCWKHFHLWVWRYLKQYILAPRQQFIPRDHMKPNT